MLSLTELGHGRQGQIKMGRVKQVGNPHVGVKDESVCHLDAECSYLSRGTYTDCRGVALYPLNSQTRINSQCMRTCSSKKGGLYMHPWKIPQTITINSLGM